MDNEVLVETPETRVQPDPRGPGFSETEPTGGPSLQAPKIAALGVIGDLKEAAAKVRLKVEAGFEEINRAAEKMSRTLYATQVRLLADWFLVLARIGGGILNREVAEVILSTAGGEVAAVRTTRVKADRPWRVDAPKGVSGAYRQYAQMWKPLGLWQAGIIVAGEVRPATDFLRKDMPGLLKRIAEYPRAQRTLVLDGYVEIGGLPYQTPAEALDDGHTLTAVYQAWKVATRGKPNIDLAAMVGTGTIQDKAEKAASKVGFAIPAKNGTTKRMERKTITPFAPSFDKHAVTAEAAVGFIVGILNACHVKKVCFVDPHFAPHRALIEEALNRPVNAVPNAAPVDIDIDDDEVSE